MATKGFVLFLAGAEVPGWKTMLTDARSPMSVSFWGLYHRRLPKTKPYLIEERFDTSLPILLDSGGHSANKQSNDSKKITKDALFDYAQRYEDFIIANIDAITMVSEFDSLRLGREWMMQRRADFYDHLPPEKFMAVWHPDFGLPALREDAERYDVIGVTATALKNAANIQPVLNQIARTTHIHAIGMTKPDDLRVVQFSSASSTSWLSPSQYGDTIFWDGARLHRFPKAYKERARKTHKARIEKAGFDAEAVLADDVNEVLRLSIWSWMQQATVLATQRRPKPALDPFTVSAEREDDQCADISDAQLVDDFAQIDEGKTAHDPSEPHNSPSQAVVVQKRSEKVMLPGLAFREITAKSTSPEGEEESTTYRVLDTVTATVRRCDNCYVADSCPKYQPSHECAFEIPVETKTPEQRTAVRHGVIAMQAERVAFLRFAEQASGGMIDPNLNEAMKLLDSLMKTNHEIEDDRDSFEMSIKGRAQAGAMSRIFGRSAPPAHRTVDSVTGADVTETYVDPIQRMIEMARPQ